MNKINCKQLTLATICLNPRHKLTFKNFHHLRTKSINYFWCVDHRFFFYFCSNLCLLQGQRKSTTKLTKSLTRWWKRTYFIQWVVIIAFCIVSFTLTLLSAAVFSTLFLIHLPPSRRGEFVSHKIKIIFSMQRRSSQLKTQLMLGSGTLSFQDQCSALTSWASQQANWKVAVEFVGNIPRKGEGEMIDIWDLFASHFPHCCNHVITFRVVCMTCLEKCSNNC